MSGYWTLYVTDVDSEFVKIKRIRFENKNVSLTTLKTQF